MTDIIAFPQGLRVGKARHVAAVINGKRTAHAREVYYRTICKQMAEQMQRAGIDETEVARQVEAFTAAVNRCIAEGWQFTQINDHHQGPGAA